MSVWDLLANHERHRAGGEGSEAMTIHRTRENGRRAELIRNPKSETRNSDEVDYDELFEPWQFHFALDRRNFVQILGGGALVTAIGSPVLSQRRGGGRGRGGFFGGAPAALSARFHFADDGMIGVFT